MIEKSLRVLEYEKVLAMLKSQAASTLGGERCLALRPLKSIKQVRKMQEETDEARSLLEGFGNPPLFGIYNLSEVLVYAEKGGTLSMASLLDVSANLRASQGMKEYLGQEENIEQVRLLKDMTDRLMAERSLAKEIEATIVSEDEIADNASPRLMRIRSSLHSKNEEVRQKINSILASSSDYLQDNLATIRDGRHVVPVKSQYRNTFKGIVHDTSASGATVFIEPMAVVNINNEIKILMEEEKDEIERILRKLSEKVADKSMVISANQNILMDLDFIFARAKLSRLMDGTCPKLNQDGFIKLVNARHPLIGGDVVPISLELGKDFTSLLITGPNTGGKTVSLKTVGLLTLMAMSGLYIPADGGSEISIFDQVFADIGDEQSIEQSLSTFSSHMTNIVNILDNLSDKSLVLFDELGAGTDPTEGSALAIAILDYLLSKKIRTLATTHYAELKLYALNTQGVENASVEFDLETLKPTYKLRVGTIGKSNAFEISKRLGIPMEIIDYASDLLTSEDRTFEDALVSIEEDRKTIEDLKAEILKKEEEARLIQARLEGEKAKLEARKERIVGEAKKEAAQILKDAKDRAQESIRELNELRKDVSKESMSRAHELKRDLDQSHKDYRESDFSFLNVRSDEDVGDLKLGDEVEVINLGQSGQVVELPNSKGDLVVEIGILKINTNVAQLKRAKSKEDTRSKTSIKNIIKARMEKKVELEKDIRGMNIEEARASLDIYLDDAFLSGLKEVRIIHGKGTGVLRKGVQEYLRTHRLVLDFRDGNPDEGGYGVTMAKIKE